MDNMFWVAVFCGFWYGFSGWRPGYSTHEIWIFPLMPALPIGLLMGDLSNALIIGCAISMMYVGLVAPGSEMPADMSLAGLIGIPLALAIGADTGTAISIAVPFGVLGVFLNQLRRIINCHLARMSDKYALQGNTKGITACAIWWPLVINMVTKFPFAFAAVYFGADVVQAVIDMLPAFVMNGLSAAGGLMPAIGFAVLIRLIATPSIFPFFFIGFFLVKIFAVSSIQAACIGIPMAIIIVLMSKESQDETVRRAVTLAGISTDDDDDDDE